MKKIVKIGITVFIAVMTVLAMTGCPQSEEVTFSDDATLTGIALNNVTGSKVPKPVPESNWGVNIGSMPYNLLFAADAADLAQATVTATLGHKGASAQYGRGTIDDGPAGWNRDGVFLGLSNGEFIYISVRSESGKVRNYYRMQVSVKAAESDPTLQILTINGRWIDGFVPYDNPEKFRPISEFSAPGSGNVNFTESQPIIPQGIGVIGDIRVTFIPGTANNVTVAAIPANAGTTFQTAVVKYGNTFSSSVQFSDTTGYRLDEGDTLWVKATSLDKTNSTYYAGRVRITDALESVTVDGHEIDYIGSGGQPANAAVSAGTPNYGRTVAADTWVAQGKIVKATPYAGSGFTVTRMGVGGVNSSSPSSWESVTNGEYTLPRQIIYNEFVYIETTNSIGDSYYFRFNVEALSPTLSNIYIGQPGDSATATMGTPQAAPWAGTGNTGTVSAPTRLLTLGEVYTTQAEAWNPDQSHVPNGGNATRTFAVVADATTVPPDTAFGPAPVAGGFTPNGYLFVKSAAAAPSTSVLYYKVLINPGLQNNQASLSGVTLDGTSQTSLPTGNATWGSAAAVLLQYETAPASINVVATATDSISATVEYAIGTAAPSTWQTSGNFTSPANSQYITVRVTAQNGTTVMNYRWRVSVGGSSAALASATVDGTAQATLPGGNAAWAGGSGASAGVAITLDYNTAPASISVVATPADTRATVTYARGTAAPSASDWQSSGTFANPASGQYIAAQIVSGDGLTTMIYRWRISIGGSQTGLVSVTVNGVTYQGATQGMLPAGNTAWGSATAATIAYLSVPDSVSVVATPTDPRATVSYAIGTAAPSAGDLQSSGTFTSPANNDYITARVVSGDGTTTTYYRWRVMY